MRGKERRQRAMLMIMEPGDRVPREHPLRRVKELADTALAQLSPLFDEMYSEIARPPIPPERLLEASLLMALYTEVHTASDISTAPHGTRPPLSALASTTMSGLTAK